MSIFILYPYYKYSIFSYLFPIIIKLEKDTIYIKTFIFFKKFKLSRLSNVSIINKNIQDVDISKIKIETNDSKEFFFGDFRNSLTDLIEIKNKINQIINN